MENEVAKYKAALKKAHHRITELTNEIKKNNEKSDIAIIGYSCKFPGGANSPDSFWEILENGVDVVSEISESRFDTALFYSEAKDEAGKMYTKNAALLEGDINQFDPHHFELSAIEASSMDPQQRLLLEVSWQALENAGVNLQQLRGTHTGVFLGINAADYIKSEMFSGDTAKIGAYSTTGISFNAASGRLAYFYDLKGPAISYDTACSSSLVALNGAVKSMRNNECEMAIVAGVNLLLEPESFVGLSKIQGLSKDGRCKSFDASADGFGRGEGCGVIILKKADDARNHGHTLHALVKSVYVAQDGRTNGFTAPNGLSQKHVIKKALEEANLMANDISYVETHGAGTALGDYIEAQALSSVFNHPNNKLLMGSVKSNIGHLEAAAGIAGIIKVLLAIKHRKIPPTLHFKNPNPNIDWSKLKVADQLTDWETTKGGKRRAGISSFGFSGTIAHAVIEEPPADERETTFDELPYHIMTLSAKNENALLELISKMKNYLTDKQEGIANICYTTNMSRSYLKHKFAITGRKKEDFIQKIGEVLKHPHHLQTHVSSETEVENNICFMFTGQGSIYKNIGKNLYETSSIFKNAFDLCNEKFKQALNVSIIDAIYGEEDVDLIKKSIYSQPIIFSVQYALIRIWHSLGVKPRFVIGHSIGEYAAAYCAGLFTLDHAVLMIAQRGLLMDAAEIDGKMVSVLTDIRNIKESIEESNCHHVSIAAINAPKNITLSGIASEVDEVISIVQKRERVFVDKLAIDKPYHSQLMNNYIKKYEKRIKDVEFLKLKISFISTITGKLIKEEIIGKPDYWAKHLTQTVRFEKAIQAAQKIGATQFIEMGGDATLAGLGQQCLEGENVYFLPTLRKGVNDYQQLLESVAQLYLRGTHIDYETFHESYQHKLVSLPNYPFQKKVFSSVSAQSMGRSEHVNEEKNRLKKAREKTLLENSDKKALSSNQEKSVINISMALKEIIKGIIGLAMNEIDQDTQLLSLGFDSLLLMNLKKDIDKKYGIEMTLNQFFLDLNTVRKMSEYIYEKTKDSDLDIRYKDEFEEEQEDVTEKNMPDEKRSTLAAVPTLNQLEMVQELFKSQMKIMSEQIEMIGKIHGLSTENQTDAQFLKVETHDFDERGANHEDVESIETFAHRTIPFKESNLMRTEKVNEIKSDALKLKYIENVTKRYTQLTAKSKISAQAYRQVFSSPRNVAGFNPLFKEMIYQIVANKAEGSKIYDLDGNAWIDLTMGFGVHLLGHHPKLIEEALYEEIGNGMPLGPMGRLVGKVSTQIRELTGVERVSFVNSGTEAVMVALRIARAVTQKSKIVLFWGAFHGTFDGILGIPSQSNHQYKTAPLAPGVNENMIKDLIVLNYDSEASLEIIQKNATDIAAVLVEPVQSRNPDIQPIGFLKKLRNLTADHDIALIFDEIITGFRISAGGVQEQFGIKADIVTYGKVLGGGMPIGVVAGAHRFLDSIDGGMWDFGDESIPSSLERKTFVAGTFSNHPLTMAAAHAMLTYIAKNKEVLYQELNEKTNRFVQIVNQYLIAEKIPIKVVHFGSLFRFVMRGDFEIFFFGLLEKGIYIWEGRNCFLSTAHSSEDVEKIISAIQLTVQEMKVAGYFGDLPTPPDDKGEASKEKMSVHQQRLFSEIMIDQSDPYNNVNVLKIRGDLDVERVETVFRQLVNRHEALRSVLYLENGEFVQKVVDHLDFSVHLIQSDDELGVEKILDEIVEAFDLSKAPLFKVSFIKLPNRKGFLVFDMHHTIVDGLSLNLLAQEFMKLYADIELPFLTAQYQDYIIWEDKYLKSNQMKKDKAYWMNRLSGEIEKLDLPLDFSRKAKQDFVADVVYLKIQSDILQKLKLLSRRNESSLFMVLLAAFNVLLQKLTGNQKIMVGTPVSNRGEGGFEHCVGMFTNTIVLKNLLDSSQSFKSFLKEVRQGCLEAYTHMNYPFSLLAKDLDVRQDPIFNTMFVYENANERVFKLKDLEVEAYDYKTKTANFDFELEVLEAEDVLNVSLTYQTELFERASIERWGQYFEEILNQVANHDDMVLSHIQMITQDEINQLLVDFNDTFKDDLNAQTIHELFEKQVAKDPHQTAIVYQNEQVSYKRLNERANQIGRLLIKNSMRKETIVGVMLERDPFMVSAILGIWKVNGAYLPIDVSYPKKRMIELLNDSGVSVLVSRSEFISPALENEFKGRIIRLDQEEWKKEDNFNLHFENDMNSLAYVIYTSGSTGKPKGAMVEHKGMMNHLYAKITDLNISEKSIVAQNASHCFDISVWQFFSSLVCGGTVAIYPNHLMTDVSEFVDSVVKNKVNILEVVPSFLEVLLDQTQQALEDLKYLLVTGEELKLKLVKSWFDKFPDIKMVNAYGPTEVSDDITHHIMKESPNSNRVPIGKPIQNLKIYIVDEEMNLCPIGVKGEIVVSGVGVGRGYLNNRDQTREAFMIDPFRSDEMCRLYKTGDLGRWLTDGTLEFFGRMDHQVKIRGFRIELGEIENHLLKHPKIKEAVVVVIEDEWSKSLVAYFVRNGKLTEEALKEHLSKELPDYMMPTHFVTIDEMPLTDNGKIDRKALPQVGKKAGFDVQYAAPNKGVEEILANIWEEVLGVKKIGVNDNFYHLGGDSIKAIQISSRLTSYQMKVDVRYLLEKPSIKEVSKHVEVATKKSETNEVVVGDVALTPIQRWFFEEKWIKQNHWNMAIMLNRKAGYDEEKVLKVFEKIIEHHDALRMTYQMMETGKVRQYNRGLEEGLIEFKVVNLNECEHRQVETIVGEVCHQIHSSFNLEKGPLVKIAIFKTNEGDHLLIAIHHLIFDVASWQILLEDLATGYRQLEAGKEIVFQHKTDSYQKWANHLKAYANSQELLNQRSFWENIVVKQEILPVDQACDHQRMADDQVKRVTLIPKMAKERLEGANEVYHTKTDDLLIAALAMAINQWKGLENIVVNLKHQGRDFVEKGIDITRTIGWFESQYPILLAYSKVNDLSYLIKYTKEILRKISPKGKDYQLLKYLSTEKIKGYRPEISFNYSDPFNFDHVIDDQDFVLSSLPIGEAWDAQNQGLFKIEMDAFLQGHQLMIKISYNKNEYKEESICKFSDLYQSSLEKIMSHCMEKDQVELTPSDLGDSELTLEELDNLNQMYGGFVDE